MKKTIFFMTLIFCVLCFSVVQGATIGELMGVATEPIGKCLYVYGGGWNEEDTAAGVEALSYGISPVWVDFYNKNSSDYDYKKTRYQIHNGLDCTGYVGWCMYQLFGDTYSDTGYVFVSGSMAKEYERIFGAEVTPSREVRNFKCGDIMTNSGHVYIVLGECKDDSVVFMHASPPNVSICGTYTPGGKKSSMAVSLAEEYMEKYFPECYKRYPGCSRNTSYLTDYNRVSLPDTILQDPDGYKNMEAEQILRDMFENMKLYVDGERVAFNDDIFIKENSTFVPLRVVSENLGATVEWNSEAKKVMIYQGKTQIEVFINSDCAYVNGNFHKLPHNVFINNDKTYIPVRFIAEQLGADVRWEGDWKRIFVEK